MADRNNDREIIDAEWEQIDPVSDQSGGPACGEPKRGRIRASTYVAGVAIGLLAITFLAGADGSQSSATTMIHQDHEPTSIAPSKALPAASKSFPSQLTAAAAEQGAPSARQIEREYSADYHQCMNASGWGDAAIRECIGAEVATQDARLNQAYVMVMRRLSAGRKLELRQSERAWIRERDFSCDQRAAPEKGGTIYFVIHGGCILDATIARRKFLERYR